MIEAAMIWNEPNNKSHWDPEIDPDWKLFSDMVTVAGQAIRAESPHLPRVLGGISPIDPGFIKKLEAHGALDHLDVVLFMGVLYHLRHPLLALDLIHEHVAKDMLVFQSMQRGSKDVLRVEENYTFWQTEHFDDPRYPKMHFIEHRYADDPTNWWAPNSACVEAMLRSAGFEIVQHPETEVYICRRVDAPPGAEAVYPAKGRSR